MTAGRSLDFALLNGVQREFPLVERPYAVLATRLRTSETAVRATLGRLIEEGSVSRVGAVFAPRRVGASTLAAMAVPPHLLDAVAARVGACREVNHSYEREHALNLWFVATAADEAALARALAGIERAAGIGVLSLPLVAEYHIDLGFDLTGQVRMARRAMVRHRDAVRPALDPSDRALVAALAPGLRLVAEPFAALAARAGLQDARDVLDRLGRWTQAGIVRRFGVVLHHRALGYVANAMCVWDVPDDAADAIGRALAREPAITLCYGRRRGGARGPYDRYCMIHGRSRDEVLAALRAIAARHGLDAYAGAVLFSRRAFKQRGADYGPAERDVSGIAHTTGASAHG
jgi:DNA-binding Lrp family transcriptional regulator